MAVVLEAGTQVSNASDSCRLQNALEPPKRDKGRDFDKAPGLGPMAAACSKTKKPMQEMPARAREKDGSRCLNFRTAQQ